MLSQISTNANINQTSAVECEKCGYLYFGQGVHIRKVSGILTGTGKPGLLPIPIFYCLSCNHINEEFLPKLKDEI